MSDLLPVSLALQRILKDAVPISAVENVELADAGGRPLATDLPALRTQPPFPASAMDGYAVAHPGRDGPATWRCIGASAAGHPFDGNVGPGECVRIFTGAIVPKGTDTVLIQENAVIDGDHVTFERPGDPRKFVRPAGLDFREGEICLREGDILSASRTSLCAAMGYGRVPCIRRPKVAVLANGDELRLPGERLGPGEIVASNSFGVLQIAREAGADVVDLGIARDDVNDLVARMEAGMDGGADVIVTLGGASVGDHDLVSDAYARVGVRPDFMKLAMRPGKPVMFGRSPEAAFLGLPGNPVSSLVGSIVFLVPLLRRLRGEWAGPTRVAGRLARAIDANDEREEYARAKLEWDGSSWLVDPYDRQDSSMLRVMADADALLVRSVRASAAERGETCEFIPLRTLEDLRNKARTD